VPWREHVHARDQLSEQVQLSFARGYMFDSASVHLANIALHQSGELRHDVEVTVVSSGGALTNAGSSLGPFQ
jgi:hydrogenase/urease accessory protein HupE